MRGELREPTSLELLDLADECGAKVFNFFLAAGDREHVYIYICVSCIGDHNINPPEPTQVFYHGIEDRNRDPQGATSH